MYVLYTLMDMGSLLGTILGFRPWGLGRVLCRREFHGHGSLIRDYIRHYTKLQEGTSISTSTLDVPWASLILTVAHIPTSYSPITSSTEKRERRPHSPHPF